MKILKIVYHLKDFLLLIVCIILLYNKLFIEGGLIALIIFSSISRRKIIDLELRIRELENNE